MSKNVCYVEDAEEDSETSVLEGIRDTRRYAVSEAPGPASPPPKERPNTGKSRGEHRRHTSRRQVTPPSDDYSDEEPRPPPRREERSRRDHEREREREQQREQRDKDRRRKERKQKEAAELQQRKVRAEAKQQAQAQAQAQAQQAPREREGKPARRPRPTSLSHTRTEPVIQQYRRGRVEDPSCYGVQQPAVSGMRPRAQTRPHSYYPGQPAPPISNAGWHHHQHSQPSFPVGSFPGPSPYFPGASSPSVSGIPPSPSPVGGGPPGFFDMPSSQASAHLRNRFERPASSMGFRQDQPSPSNIGYPQDEYEVEEQQPEPPRPLRRASRSSRKPPPQQIEDDRRRMPPPDSIPRPKSAMPSQTTPFRAPPQTLTRQKTRTPSRPPPSSRSRVGFADQQGYDDEDFTESPGLFADSPEANFDRRTALTSRPRRSSVAYEGYGADIIPARSTRRGSVAYERGGIDIIPARNTRRDSFYDYDQYDSGGASLDEDKYLDAMKYQDDINGGPAMPLTAAALRKASNPRLGGGSSRSSGSHDDSEYKRSNTTGLTRSSSSDTDNVTIKVSGSAVVRVSGAEIECGDGGEITFSRPTAGSRLGSDRASSYYQLEDVQSRVERKALPYRPHTPSRSDSHHRGYSGNHAPYDPSLTMDDYIY
ncbi:hypothetical protein FVEN_g8935 [Fusarium venenatum]|uniref:Uncharacterized protein n=1 Tax=Fusarium venenatum TaxID=56646 RepID=A0A2L2TVQ9_9HYPO|nr:uncharacterized protein FVRRES_02192 [Fusarium venenatum]KAG8353229.1 hypothetical protein FVEN_g8935 [Fusarium venenatum]KAH7004680.1 hypothetical protein EDB82DRAFT_520694 [Fusarium venenatum]CEI65680.1 unnamed protein product [Fusarium venenatum]